MLELKKTRPGSEPISSLHAEHDMIIKVLAAFERWSNALLLEGKEDRLALKRFLRFFTEFEDACHHVKEERILFECMARSGFPKNGGPVAVMLAEHEEGREIMRALERIANQAAPWTNEDCGKVSAQASAYVSLMRRHIDKEEKFLYPRAEAKLPEEAWTEIAEGFASLDEEYECAGAQEELKELAAVLTLH